MSSAYQRQGILVGVDGSPSSRAAVRWAARDAGMRHVELTLVHIIAPVASIAAEPEIPAPPGYVHWQDEQAKQLIADADDAVVNATTNTGPSNVRSEVLHAPTIPELVALSQHAELMVVGCRGQGAVSRTLIGSVSSALVHRAHCPVVVVHEQYLSAPRPEAPVLVGIDGSPASELATEIAFDEAARRNATLVALHAWSDVGPLHAGMMYWAPDGWATIRVGEQEVLAERLAGWQERYPDVTVKRIVVCDQPAHQLLKYARRSQLVVVGSHGRGGFTGMLLGSVGRAVVNSARVPVIVARS